MKTTTRNALRAAAALSFLAVVGCNTVEGLGDDLKGASQSTKEAISGNSSSTKSTGVEGQGSTQSTTTTTTK